MPLEVFPVITGRDVVKARRDQIETVAIAVGSVAGITAVNYRFNAPFGPLVQKPLQFTITGVEAKPTPSGRASIRLPTPSIFAAFLPGPVGYVPGEWLGLHPAIVRRTLGVGAGKKPLIFEPSDERKRVFDATITAERIAANALGTEVIFGRASGHPFRAIPPGRINVTEEELQFLESLPPGLTPAQRLIPELQARRGELTPSGVLAGKLFERFAFAGGTNPQPVPTPPMLASGPVPPGSMQPEHAKPVNAKALANEAAAEGIRRALVSERFDP